MKTSILFLVTSRSVFLRVKNVSDSCRKNRNIHFVFNNFYYSCCLWDVESIVQRGRPQVTIWRIRIAYWITMATNTHSEYVVLIAFPLQQFGRKCLNVTLPVHCLSCWIMPRVTETLRRFCLMTWIHI